MIYCDSYVSLFLKLLSKFATVVHKPVLHADDSFVGVPGGGGVKATKINRQFLAIPQCIRSIQRELGYDYT